MRPAAVLFAISLLSAQTPLSPALDALVKVRTRMNFNLEHQPNYTCVETVERSKRPKSNGKMKLLDVLRMEVALVDGREMFAWPGSKKFEEFDITTMVTSGAIGNGDFGIHARALFGTRAATFHYLGEQDFRGKKAIKFDYNVPLLLSGYKLSVGAANAIVAYHGSVYADPSTYDVKRIEVITQDIPPALLLSSTTDAIDYALTRIGDTDFLLPSESDLTMFALDGSEDHNHLKFTACRQFSGESVLTFADAPGSSPEAAPVPVREFDLPSGLDMELMVTQEINLRTLAIGDPIQVRIVRDVKQKGTVVVPKGATATGRIVRFEKYDDHSILGVEFPEIEAPGLLARMKGKLDHIVGNSMVSSRWSLRGRTPLLPGEGAFLVSSAQLHLVKGCIMFWRT
jgi:hypothetical protein